MSQTWYSLYIPADSPSKVADALRKVLEAHHYRSYDPFPGGTGTPTGMRDLVRLFVAPEQDGWVRVLGEPAAELLPDLSRALDAPMLYGWLTEDGGGLALFHEGTRYDDPDSFASHLRSRPSLDALKRAFAGEVPVPPVDPENPPAAILGADALPPDVQQMLESQKVNPKQANKLAGRLGDVLLGRLGKQEGESSEEQEQARQLVKGSGLDLWNSLHGQRVRAIADALKLPANWRLPSWEAVRDSYQIHRLRERNPRMALMPGDKETMQAVPDALLYIPVYMGVK